MGYDMTEGLLVRRVISRAEGNRSYINGRLATLQVLSAITENMASISGQHAHQGLLKEDQHLLMLDQFAGLMAQREAVSALVREIIPELKHLRELRGRQARQAELTELLEFQRKEIEAAGMHAGEDRELEQERTRLKNAGALVEAVQGGSRHPLQCVRLGGGALDRGAPEPRADGADRPAAGGQSRRPAPRSSTGSRTSWRSCAPT